MIVTFSYPLPDELYVEGISGDVVGTYTYDGPEFFDVQIDEFGDVVNIDIEHDPELGPNFRKTIDASNQIEAAYILSNYFIEDYQWKYEFEDEIMENGDIYKKILNPDLKDAYELKYNFENDDWDLIQIVKEQSNPSAIEAKRRKEYIERYSEKYTFGAEVDTMIEEYISELDTYIENNPPLKSWKYTHHDLKKVPKIPLAISVEIAKIPSEGV